MNFIYFILGMLTTLFIIPLLENILAYICNGLELLRTKQNKEISLIGIEVQKKMDEIENEPRRLIGFVSEETEIEEEDDEYDL